MSALDVAAKTEQDPASCWETPAWLGERIREAFGGSIDLDPCTTAANPMGARRFYAPPDDGILPVWHTHGTVYINPPYGRTIHHWIGKAVNAAATPTCKIILLVPARTDSQWWHHLQRHAAATIFFRGRIRFKNSNGSPKFPSALVGLNHNLHKLRDLGSLMRPYEIWTNGRDAFAEPA
jgi:phage N-6-adenine-methyltransferase